MIEGRNFEKEIEIIKENGKAKNSDTSFSREDFITLDTAKPPVHRPIQSLQFGPEPPGTQRVSTYKDTYPKILAYQKRQAIPNRADHWIDKPEKVYGDTTTTYESKEPK